MRKKSLFLVAVLAIAFSSCINPPTPESKIVGKWQVVRETTSSLLSSTKTKEYNGNGTTIEFLDNHTAVFVDSTGVQTSAVWEWDGDKEHIVLSNVNEDTGWNINVPLKGAIISKDELSLSCDIGFANAIMALKKL